MAHRKIITNHSKIGTNPDVFILSSGLGQKLSRISKGKPGHILLLTEVKGNPAKEVLKWKEKYKFKLSKNVLFLLKALKLFEQPNKYKNILSLLKKEGKYWMHQDTHDHENNMQCDIPINKQLRAHFINF